MQNKYKNLAISISSILLLLLFFLFRYYLTYSFIFLDDANGDVYCSLVKWLRVFKTNPFCLCFSPIFGRIFGAIIPFSFNMHPSYFKSIYFSYIEAFLLLSFIFLFVKLLNQKSDLKLPIYILFSASALFFCIQNQPLTLFVYDGFFRMIIPVMLWCLLFYSLINDIKNDKEKINIFPCLLVFLCSISNELTTISVFVSLLILSVVQTIRKNKIPYCYITYLITSIIGILILVKTNAFYRKSPDLMIDMNFILSAGKQIPEYLICFFKYIFAKHFFAYLFLISQIVFLNIKLPKNTYKNELITINICLLAGILFFFGSLIILGKTHYIEGNYWLIHEDLHLMYSIILCAFNISFFNIIIQENLIKKYIIDILLICFSVFFIYRNTIFYYSFLKSIIIPERKNYYTAEKIIRLANLKSSVAYLSETYMEDSSFWPFFDDPDEQKDTKINENSRYIEYLNQFEKNQKINTQIIFTDENTVNAEFKNNGGIITDEELKNINFNNLTDKNFLLNKPD